MIPTFLGIAFMVFSFFKLPDGPFERAVAQLKAQMQLQKVGFNVVRFNWKAQNYLQIYLVTNAIWLR